MISRVVSKIKQKGFRWFIWKLEREFRAPSIPLLKSVIDKSLYFKKQISKIWSKTKEDDLLYAIYDLDINAISFNVAEFLIDAEIEANRRGKRGFVLVFIPRSNDPNLTCEEYDSLYDADSKHWKFQNLVVPIAFLSKICKGAYLLPKRSDVIGFVKGRDVYPDLYDGFSMRGIDPRDFYRKIDRPNLFEGLRAPEQGMRYIQAWILESGIKDPIVTITIRDCLFDKARNSNIAEWSRFAIYLRSAGYNPVVVPDTDTAFCEDRRFDGITLFKECAWNIGLRASLYESAFLNFFVPNGCTTLAMFNPQCSYIMMNSLPAGSMVTTEAAYKLNNHPIGANYKFATPNQRLCFKPDTFENMVSEFEQFVKDQKSRATNETPISPTNTGIISG